MSSNCQTFPFFPFLAKGNIKKELQSPESFKVTFNFICVLFIFQLTLSQIYFSSYFSFFWKALYNSESFLRVKLHSYPFQFSTFSTSDHFLGSHRFENWKQLCYLEGIHFLLYFSCVKVHLLIFQCHPQLKSIPFSSLATTTPDNTLFLFHLLLIVS